MEMRERERAHTVWPLEAMRSVHALVEAVDVRTEDAAGAGAVAAKDARHTGHAAAHIGVWCDALARSVRE
jgi:hypothetical protein